MANILAILVVLAIVVAAAGYVIRAKRHGRKCIGCPDSKTCSGRCMGSCTGCTLHGHDSAAQ